MECILPEKIKRGKATTAATRAMSESNLTDEDYVIRQAWKLKTGRHITE